MIVLDLTDPGGPSTALYTPEFYEACARRLTPMGAMTMHIGSPVAHPDRVRAALADLQACLQPRDAVFDLGSALRRSLDDGVLRSRPRPARAFGNGDRRADLAAKAASISST